MRKVLARSFSTIMVWCSHFSVSSTDRALARERATRCLKISKSVYHENGKTHLLTVALTGCLFSLLLGSSALANDVQPGLDLFQTDPGTTFQDFSGAPIPADFFGPGSDPFDGGIALQGNPQPTTRCPDDDLSGVDTIVERLGVSTHPTIPSTDFVAIEIVELHLRSVAPITVTYNGGQNPELWDVEVELSPSVPQQPGQMDITHLNPTGGTFDSALPVVPMFIFIRQIDGMVLVLDLGELAFLPPLLFEAQGVPWVHVNPPAASCTSNFCVNPGDLTVEQALLASHGIISICPEATSPNDVQPGFDLFETPPGATFKDFFSNPIPADFFDPGSDPFDGIIDLQGNPQPSALCPGDDLSRVDTIVERLGVSSHPTIPSTDFVDIEIVELNLTSIDPITVTHNGGQDPELWDVDIELSSSFPQQPGTMTITHQDPRGGVFDSFLPVIPVLTFTRQIDGAVRVLDPGPAIAPALSFQAQDVPWVHVDPPPGSCTSNFCANPGNLTLEQALLGQHGVISICPEDFGDAPDPTYPTLLASNGARHVIVPGFFLGASVDPEPDGQPNATATGDDIDGNDDEDGVAFTTLLIPGQPAGVTVSASVPGLLNAWIDFNGNGSWGDPGEQIFTNLLLLPGPNPVGFGVPAGSLSGPTFARFRFSSAPVSFDGLAPDGEVEDYQVLIEERPRDIFKDSFE